MLLGLGLTVTQPFAGVLLWAWFNLQSPHEVVYGMVQSLPLNLIIAITTLGALLISRERKLPPVTAVSILMVAFLAWMTFNSFFAYAPDWSWQFWSRTWKTFLFGLVVAATATSRERLYALSWVAVISLFYYGVKGGMFTIVTGGNYHVFGPADTIIGDNNSLAVALLMVLPLAEFLRGEIKNKWLARGLVLGMVLTVVAVAGTYSRGAMLGLGALALLMLLRTRKKVIYIALALIVAIFVLKFMPSGFFQRMDTIGTASQDASFNGRLISWRVAALYATDHFPFGAGFYAPQLAPIYHHYFPHEAVLAAHSIYFQVLGEHGFIGLALYVLLIVAAFLLNLQIIRGARKVPELYWAKDLGVALQASLLVFCVSGALLSMAYYDLFIVEVGMLIPLSEIVRARRKKAVSPVKAWTGEGTVEGLSTPYPAEI
jgi:probable O-glycosylation ligase (exosortase A-associated)